MVAFQVGLNGSGKSTLLKLMMGTLEPLDGMVKRHNHLKLGQYHQHLTGVADFIFQAIHLFSGVCLAAIFDYAVRVSLRILPESTAEVFLGICITQV